VRFAVHTQVAGPNHHLIVASGEVDLSTAGRLRHSLLTAIANPTVTIASADLSDVTFIDSTGIGALIAAYNTASDTGKTFVVVNASTQVAHVLAIVGADRLLLEIPGSDGYQDQPGATQ
jgi:anti-sigma B factor antagonist